MAAIISDSSAQDAEHAETARRLASLGVHDWTLTAAERERLDEDGYCTMPGIIDPAWLERLRAVYDRLIADEGRPGVDILLHDLVNKDQAFDRLWTHPRVLAGMHQVLGRAFKLSSLNCREPRPGSGSQGLHADWQGHVGAPPYHVANSLWVLDDMGPQNGATRLLPGSHRWSPERVAAIADVAAAHPEERILAVAAGTVVAFNAHCLHGAPSTLAARVVASCMATSPRASTPPRSTSSAMSVLRPGGDARPRTAGCWASTRPKRIGPGPGSPARESRPS